MNSNSILNAYCSLLEMLSIPDLVSEIRSELEGVGYPKLQPSEYVTVIPSKVPLLRSIYDESLRVHINAITIREVIAPTDLVTDNRTWKLEKGGVVTLAGALLHEDEEYHPHPQEFQPKRFIEKELGGGGGNAARHTKPFGGGTSYCPGRVFAEKQIIGFLAATVMRYDMKIVTKDYVIPRNSDLEFVAVGPPVYIEIKKRAGTEMFRNVNDERQHFWRQLCG
jgi:cytochrome P450